MRIRLPTRNGARRGGALVVALILVMSVAMLSAGMLQVSMSSARRQAAAVDQKRAFYVAEAGLAEAVLAHSMGKDGAIGSMELPAELGDGLFWVEASALGDGIEQLECTALVGTGKTKLSIAVEQAKDPLGQFGIFGDQSLVLSSGAQIDGYNSGEGDYVAPVSIGLMGTKGRVGSNGSIRLSSGSLALNTVIGGDATPGPEGSVTLGSLSSVLGESTPATELRPLAPVQLPLIDSTGDLLLSGGVTRTLPKGESAWSRVNVPSGNMLLLKGPARVLIDKLRVLSGGKFYVDTSAGEVELYIGNYLYLASGSVIAFANTNTKAFKLVIAADKVIDHTGDGIVDQPVTLAATGSFFGSIYAPGASFSYPASMPLFGTLAAKSLTIAVGAKLHWDEALEKEGIEVEGSELLSWRVEELPPELAGSTSGDPRQLLGVEGVELPTPYEAHEEKLWSIEYVARDGSTRTWTGLQPKFDMSLVNTVVKASLEGAVDFVPLDGTRRKQE